MSYIAFDLDALNAAPAVARAAGVTENDVLGGLLRLWAWCFRSETDVVTALQLRGHFGVDAGPALEAFGFLAKIDDAWRVRGAERYLKVKASQRSAAARTNARRASGTPDGGASVDRRSTDDPATEDRSVNPRPAPITEHRTPNTSTDDDPPQAFDRSSSPLVFVEPTTPSHTWSPRDFFAWAQYVRQQAGWVAERWPRRDLGRWWSGVQMTPGMEAHRDGVDRLRAGFLAFAKDPHWRQAAPPAPFQAFMVRWRDHVPAEIPSARVAS